MNKIQVLKIVKEYLKNYDHEYNEFEISNNNNKQIICIKIKKEIK